MEYLEKGNLFSTQEYMEKESILPSTQEYLEKGSLSSSQEYMEKGSILHCTQDCLLPSIPVNQELKETKAVQFNREQEEEDKRLRELEDEKQKLKSKQVYIFNQTN